MSLQVIKQPLVELNGRIHLSKWNSLHHPIEFKLQRRDFELQSKTKVSGFVRLKINGTLPGSLAVGQNVSFMVGTIKTTAKVTQLIQPNIIVTDSTQAGSYYSGYVNLVDAYKNYFVETEIFGVNQSNVYVSLGISRNTPTTEGVIKMSVQEWLRTQAVYENQFLYNALNKMQRGEGTRFNIRYRECYNGNTYAFSSLNTLNLFYWTNSAKQIQEQYGFNMGDFVPSLDVDRTKKAKFQSVFKKPTYFKGYPFSLNFIYSDNLLNYNINKIEKTYNVNRVEVASTSDLLNMAQRQNSNRLMLKEGYTSNIKTVDVWLESGSINTNDTMNSDGIFVKDVFSPFKPLSPIFSNSPIQKR